MKSVDYTLRYDDATAEQVRAMLATPEFRERVCDFQGVLRRNVAITDSGGADLDVVIEQVQAARGIPAFAAKFVGDEITIVQTEHWTSPTAATLDVEIPGKPGQMTGSIAVAEDDAGVNERVQLSVQMKIPLVGGKIEELVAGLLTKALKAENHVGRQWLQEAQR